MGLWTRLAAATKLSECPASGPEAVTYRWEETKGGDESLYVEGKGGCVTLSDIYRDAPDTPLVPMTTEGDEVDAETG